MFMQTHWLRTFARILSICFQFCHWEKQNFDLEALWGPDFDWDHDKCQLGEPWIKKGPDFDDTGEKQDDPGEKLDQKVRISRRKSEMFREK